MMPLGDADGHSPASAARVLPILFFFSGTSSLIFETIFTRLLTYTFGNTAYAVSTVLAAFLGGLALGAVILGKWSDRRVPSLRLYGGLELLVGAFCLLIPGLFGLLTRTYVFLYQRFELGTPGLTLTRIALAAVLILLPTTLMGGTLPVIARYVAARRADFQLELDRLYALNTLGGASGVLLSTYILIPLLGVKETIALACTINLGIFITVIVVSSREAASPAGEDSSTAAPAKDQVETGSQGSLSGILLLGAFLTGAVALVYEVVWTHALSFVIGNTVYAFGIMLFTFLCGLGWGARIVARRLSRPALWRPGLAVSQVLLGITVFVTLPLWTWIPGMFERGVQGAYNFDLQIVAALLILRITYVFWRNRRHPHPETLPWFRAFEPHIVSFTFAALAVGVMPFLWKYDSTYFVAGELLRFLCAFGLLILPALLLGLAFPLLLNLYSQAAARVGGRVGKIYALNTLGTVVGSLVAGFVFLPRLGSVMTLRSCAAVNVLLGLGFAVGLLRMSRARKLAASLATGAVAGLLLLTHVGWDMLRITRGSYAYFTPGWSGQQIVFLEEDVQGGLTSVVQTGNSRTLLSNGKFQGDNQEEVGMQVRFALIPTLFTQRCDRALVIGLGTGNTLRAVALFPFRHIDAVELAPQVVEAARRWFTDVNDRVFDVDPRVQMTVADGRNFLLLSRQRYDMITIEITSLWISGEADLYNREFYQLCRAHLSKQGVLQQWVAIHHLRTQDLLVILNTAAQVFPHVAFFLGPGHGLLIASPSPLECDYQQIQAFDDAPGVRRQLEALGIPSLWSLLGELVLYDRSFERAVSWLPHLTGLPGDFASTDFRPYLEYQSPRGITLPYNTAPLNAQFLGRFRPAGIPEELTIRHVPSENERNLISGYATEERGDLRGALDYFGRVQGAALARAQIGITRVNAEERALSVSGPAPKAQ